MGHACIVTLLKWLRLVALVATPADTALYENDPLMRIVAPDVVKIISVDPTQVAGVRFQHDKMLATLCINVPQCAMSHSRISCS